MAVWSRGCAEDGRGSHATTIARLPVPACCTLHGSSSSCHGYISAWLLLCRLVISSASSCTSAHRPFSFASALGSTPVPCTLRLVPRALCLAVTPNCVTRLPSAKLQPPQPSPPVAYSYLHIPSLQSLSSVSTPPPPSSLPLALLLAAIGLLCGMPRSAIAVAEERSRLYA
jgi:hypothetical protein